MNEEQSVKSLFSTESADRVKSPEKLDEYIRVATPGTWLIVLALALMLAALFIWGFTGSLPVHYTAKGVGMTLGVDFATADKSDPEAFQVKGVLCFPDSVEITSRELQDKEVSVTFGDGTRVKGTAVLLDTTPEKDEEIYDFLHSFGVDSDWVLSRLGQGTYRYPVYIELEETLDYLFWGEVCDAAFIISTEHPIYFLLGGED